MKKKERQDKAEMEKKKLMIKEIRMLEAELIENKNNNKVQLDLTTTAGHELLGKIWVSPQSLWPSGLHTDRLRLGRLNWVEAWFESHI